MHRLNRELWATKAHSHGPRLVSIHGFAGVGKTQLALSYASQNKAQYRAVLWFPSSDEDRIKKVCARIWRGALRSLMLGNYGHDTSIEPSIWKIVDVLESLDGKWLMIFDNVVRDQMISLRGQLANASGGHVLFLSRQSLQQTLEIAIDPLDPGEAEELFLQYANLLHPTEEQREAAKIFARDLEGVPLALELAGSYLRNKPGYATDLLKHETNLHAISNAIISTTPQDYLADYKLGVFSGWETSFSAVEEQDPDAANLLLLFGMLDRNSLHRYQFRDFAINMRRIQETNNGYDNLASQAFSSLMFNTVDGLPDTDCWDFTRFEEATALLTSYHFISPNYDGSVIYMHPLVHGWASERLDRGCAKRWVSWSSIAIAFSATALPIEWSEDIKSDFFLAHFWIVKLSNYANVDTPLKQILLRLLDFHSHWTEPDWPGETRLLGRWLYSVTSPKHLDLDKHIRPNDTTPIAQSQGPALQRARALSGRNVFTGDLAPDDPEEMKFLEKLEILDRILVALLQFEEELIGQAISYYQEQCTNDCGDHSYLQGALDAGKSLSAIIASAYEERKQQYLVSIDGKDIIISRQKYWPKHSDLGLNELRQAGLMDFVSKERTTSIKNLEIALVLKFLGVWVDVRSVSDGLWMLVGTLFEIHRRMLHLSMQDTTAESYDEEGKANAIFIGLGGD